jgi:hypothetical protein
MTTGVRPYRETVCFPRSGPGGHPDRSIPLSRNDPFYPLPNRQSRGGEADAAIQRLDLWIATPLRGSP